MSTIDGGEAEGEMAIFSLLTLWLMCAIIVIWATVAVVHRVRLARKFPKKQRPTDNGG